MLIPWSVKIPHASGQLSPYTTTEPMLHNKKNYHNEKPTQHN